ncbi:hypothetical protein [Paraburkholderia bannensis]|uniref:hypothetical protein n=1 Tax=Paraburkholderia bannensis TaxID=765414 RepID=UPI002ABD3B5E|nr:hypothetical protein [Paraburkholderia bannensis]
MSDFKARLGREVPKESETRVVFSIRTSKNNRLELDGMFDEAVVLKIWGELCANQAQREKPGHVAPRATNDRERMDWLSSQVVNVRVPLPYGSRDLFWASPTDDDAGHTPSDIRARIDAARGLA